MSLACLLQYTDLSTPDCANVDQDGDSGGDDGGDDDDVGNDGDVGDDGDGDGGGKVT